ncbi:glycosyltransferase family 39 protein [Chloroflexota bacterium]
MQIAKINSILLVILTLGLSLRVYDLTDESIWKDEVITISVVSLIPVEIVENRTSNNHPPLYFLITHYWTTLAGVSVFSVRFLSVVFSVLGMAILYKLGHLMFNKEVGIVSTLILGMSPFHIFYSQDARMYTLMTFLTLLSVYFFIKLLQQDDFKDRIAYILFSCLLMYTHIYALFIIIAQNVYVFILYLFSSKSTRPNLQKWILVESSLLFLYLPWIILFLQQTFKVEGGYYWLSSPTVMSMVKSVGRYAGSVTLLLIFLLLVSFAIFNALPDTKTLGKSIRTRTWNGKLSKPNNKVFLLLLWVFIPVILPFIISKVVTPIYLTRYTIGASLALYLLVAKGINDINYKAVKLIAISLVIILSFVNIWQYYPAVNKAPWKDVVALVDANAKSGDLLLFNGLEEGNIFKIYSNRKDLIYESFPNDGSYRISQENIKTLKPTVNDYDRVWFIRDRSENLNLIKETLHPPYIFFKFGPYSAKYDNGINVYLFEKR